MKFRWKFDILDGTKILMEFRWKKDRKLID